MGGSTRLSDPPTRPQLAVADTTSRSLRVANRAQVLTEIYRSGPMTRHEIADAAGVSRGTVSNVVTELFGRGLVQEAGLLPSNGGRPHGLLQVDSRSRFVAGAAVGELSVLVELFDLDLRVLASVPAPPMLPLRPQPVAGQVAHGLAQVVAEAGVDPALVLGLGVAVPGSVEPGSRGVVHAQTIGWAGVPFGAMLAQRVGLPVQVENGARTMGEAEHWLGAARGTDHAIVVLLGTGVGTSIMIDGTVYRGPSGSAGEWGHTTVVYNGKACRCGALGCLEAYVSAGAIIDRYGQLRHRRRSAPDGDLALRVSELAAADNRAAAQVRTETADYLGAAVADLINLFNPERIVLGGWAGRLLVDRLLPQLKEVASRQALRLPYRQASIVPALLGADAVAVGAATLPLTRFLASGGS